MTLSEYARIVLLLQFLFVCAFTRADSCTCVDQRDMENLVKENEAAIQAYGDEIKRLEVEETKGNTALKFTISDQSRQRWATVQEHVQNAIDKVKGSNCKEISTTHINPASCVLEQNAQPTQCLKESVEIHEKVHQAICLEVNRQRGRIPVILQLNYQLGMRLVDMCQEEIDAYTAGKDDLQKKLAALANTCGSPVQVNLQCIDHGDGYPWNDTVSVSRVDSCNYWRGERTLEIHLQNPQPVNKPDYNEINVRIHPFTGNGSFKTDRDGNTKVVLRGKDDTWADSAGESPEPCYINATTDLDKVVIPEGYWTTGQVNLEVSCLRLNTGTSGIGAAECRVSPQTFVIDSHSCDATP